MLSLGIPRAHAGLFPRQGIRIRCRGSGQRFSAAGLLLQFGISGELKNNSHRGSTPGDFNFIGMGHSLGRETFPESPGDPDARQCV